MFRKALIANRGEIACRITTTLHRLGIESVAVFSDADADAPHVRISDEAHRIGPAQVAQSYLNMDAILAAAGTARVDAIHPGYGLLSERPEFAAACEAAGIAFIGPSAAAIQAMGSKLSARRLMRDAGVPIVPGATAPCSDADDARRLAHELGFPVLVKASSGGGGIGMQLVQREDDLSDALASCRRLLPNDSSATGWCTSRNMSSGLGTSRFRCLATARDAS